MGLSCPVTAGRRIVAMADALLYGLIGAVVGGAAVAVAMMARQVRLASRRAALEAELDAARRSIDEQRALLTQSQTQLREAFAALSQDALRQNRQDFLQNADALFQPVRDALGRVQDQLASVDKAREGSFRSVATQLAQISTAHKELRDAADGLTRALRSPHVRGRWGELQLRRIVELAGMTQQCDFTEKPVAATDSGARQMPDMVISLPGGASIVLDAKVPIDGYLKAADARTDAERQQGLAAHARQMRDHLRALGGKDYWKQFEPSPEFVVMFLPLEPLLPAALDQDPELLDQALAVRVIPATPLTLLALLKAVALGWRQEQLASNAEEIQLLGRELYERLATMVGHLEDVGRNIKQAGDSYDRLVGSLEQKVLPGARRFKDLGVQAPTELEPVDRLHLSVRPVTKPELTATADEITSRRAD
jgi:DNA recombination protein RmuC